MSLEGLSVKLGLTWIFTKTAPPAIWRQAVAKLGDAVVERLAADLRAGFPEMRGFSAGHIWRTRQFYQLHAEPEFLAQAVRELPASPPRWREFNKMTATACDPILQQLVEELASKSGRPSPAPSAQS